MSTKRTYNFKRGGSRHKYGAKETYVDNIRFPSKLEAERYMYLKALERAGTIRDLKLQPRFKLHVNGELICSYVGDFEYEKEVKEGEWIYVLEDTKGVETPEFKLKKKLMKAIHGLEINVVKKR